MLRFVSAGESHGKCLMGILEGLPAGLEIDLDFVNTELRRRQQGYGRGGRMQIERDQIDIAAGVRHGRTLGSPIGFTIQNRDWSHWMIPMSVEPVSEGANIRSISRPRPGHVDLAGALKHQTHDVRDLLERASARETAARVAAGALCKLLLRHFGMAIHSHVVAVGTVRVAEAYENPHSRELAGVDPESALPCLDPEAGPRMMAEIDRAKAAGDTLGGIVEIVAVGVPVGLGSHTQWDLKLDGLLAQALMSIPAAKAVEIGSGVAGAASFGSQVHDEIFYDATQKRFYRKTNRAGGLEAGISNGEDLRARLYMKPIPTLRKPLMSADINTKQPFEAAFERSDTCVVPAAGVIGEAMVACVLTGAFLEKFGGDSIREIEGNVAGYRKLLEDF